MCVGKTGKLFNKQAVSWVDRGDVEGSQDPHSKVEVKWQDIGYLWAALKLQNWQTLLIW